MLLSMAKTPKRPRDTNQLAKSIVDIATGEVEDTKPDDGKDPAAVALGRKGGLKGGKARAAQLNADERSAIAKAAAEARWEKYRSKQDEDDHEGAALRRKSRIKISTLDH